MVTIALLATDKIHLSQCKDLLPDGSDIIYVNSNDPISAQASALQNIPAIILGNASYPIELAKLTPDLKLLQTFSAGTDKLDKKSLGELGISVSNNGGANSIAVAEHTIALIVNSFRKMHLQFESVKSGDWRGNVQKEWSSQAEEISGKTVGIIGFGRIGQSVAKRLIGWECNVIFHDIVSHPMQSIVDLNSTKVSLEQLLSESDIITLHVPLNNTTTKMISYPEFETMKSTAILINACRGPVVDEEALIHAIVNKQISGAALDVTENEPINLDNRLLELDNVLITPHLAAMSAQFHTKARSFAVYNCVNVALGKDPESTVIPD